MLRLHVYYLVLIAKQKRRALTRRLPIFFYLNYVPDEKVGAFASVVLKYLYGFTGASWMRTS